MRLIQKLNPNQKKACIAFIRDPEWESVPSCFMNNSLGPGVCFARELVSPTFDVILQGRSASDTVALLFATISCCFCGLLDTSMLDDQAPRFVCTTCVRGYNTLGS